MWQFFNVTIDEICLIQYLRESGAVSTVYLFLTRRDTSRRALASRSDIGLAMTM